MAQLKQDDIQEIIMLFEHELNTLKRIRKVERMKMRKRIVNVLNPALSVSSPRRDVILYMVEDKLSDVLDLFLDGYGFRKKLASVLSKKLKALH